MDSNWKGCGQRRVLKILILRAKILVDFLSRSINSSFRWVEVILQNNTMCMMSYELTGQISIPLKSSLGDIVTMVCNINFKGSMGKKWEIITKEREQDQGKQKSQFGQGTPFSNLFLLVTYYITNYSNFGIRKSFLLSTFSAGQGLGSSLPGFCFRVSYEVAADMLEDTKAIRRSEWDQSI